MISKIRDELTMIAGPEDIDIVKLIKKDLRKGNIWKII